MSAPATPKRPARRKTPKRPATRVVRKKTLPKASPESVFYVSDGKVITDLEELGHALDEIADSVFEHHVNDSKNDFANWIEGVFKEKELAKVLRSTTSKDRNVIEVLKVVVKKK